MGDLAARALAAAERAEARRRDLEARALQSHAERLTAEWKKALPRYLAILDRLLPDHGEEWHVERLGVEHPTGGWSTRETAMEANLADLVNETGRIKIRVVDGPRGRYLSCYGQRVTSLADLGRALKKQRDDEDERMFGTRGNTD